MAAPIQQANTTLTYVQPVTIPVTVPTQPMVSTSGQPQQFSNFCVLCTSIGRHCPNNYLLPIHPEWIDSKEEGKDLNKQDREEEEKQEAGDWDGTIQKA